MCKLINGIDHGVNSDRLVPRYTKEQWSNPPKTDLGNEEIISNIITSMEEACAAKVIGEILEANLPHFFVG